MLWLPSLLAFPLLIQRLMFSAPPFELSRRILARLETAEAREPNPHFQDDYRIAWITVLRADRGGEFPRQRNLRGLRAASQQSFPGDDRAQEAPARIALRRLGREFAAEKASAVGSSAAALRGLKGEFLR